MDLDNKSHLVEIVATLKEVTALISSATGMPDAAVGLTKAMSDIMPAHIRCGVTLISEGRPSVLASSAVADDVLDETISCAGDGPCLSAIRARDIIVSHDLAAETRWPAWTRLARQHGISGVLCYPFDVDTYTLGAVNLYAEKVHSLNGDVPIVAMLMADHASLLLKMRRQQFLQDEQLLRAMAATEGDTAVERAVGIVMAQRGCPPEQALRHLHDAATHLGADLSLVAQRLVHTVAERGTPA